MRYKALKACLSGVLCLVATHLAWGDTLRCGNSVVEVGEAMADVQAVCGSPADVQHSVFANATTTQVGGGTRSTVGAEVPVETWTYNRGPNQLMVSIRFVDGKVTAINTLHEYGQ